MMSGRMTFWPMIVGMMFFDSVVWIKGCSVKKLMNTDESGLWLFSCLHFLSIRDGDGERN